MYITLHVCDPDIGNPDLTRRHYKVFDTRILGFIPRKEFVIPLLQKIYMHIMFTLAIDIITFEKFHLKITK